MPIFHLHIRLGDALIPDLEGIDLPDLAAARAEAVRGARAIMSTAVLDGTLRLDGSIEIHDAAGARCCTLRFRDAIAIVGDDERD